LFAAHWLGRNVPKGNIKPFPIMRIVVIQGKFRILSERRSLMQPVTQYAKSGDVYIAYQVFGEGAINVVLAPPFVSNIKHYWEAPDFARWLFRLASNARAAMFDKRGTGLSDRVSELPGLDQRIDDLRAVMDATGMEQAALIGISEGGPMTALFAATYPARCRALVLCGSYARGSGVRLAANLRYIETEQWGTGGTSTFAPSREDDPAFQRWWGRVERLGASPAAASALVRMNSQIDISNILPTIRVPTLSSFTEPEIGPSPWSVDVIWPSTFPARVISSFREPTTYHSLATTRMRLPMR
jgi:pimeloyl-ACP methyl ester carboxylesterase